MNGLYYILGVLVVGLWVASGWASFVYWWTWEWDYTTDDRKVAAAAALVGPLAWFIGWHIHAGNGPTRYSTPVGQLNPWGYRVIKQCRRRRAWN